MREITVEQLKERLDAGEKLHIIDVREPNEYAEYNIGAQLIPLGNILSMQLDDIEDEAKLNEFALELIDRFGPLPKQVEELFTTIRCRAKAKTGASK